MHTEVHPGYSKPKTFYKIPVSTILLQSPEQAVGQRPQGVTSKREQVIKHIAESMREVKSIIDRLPDRLSRIGQPKNKDISELANIMTSKISRTESASMHRADAPRNYSSSKTSFMKASFESKVHEKFNQERVVNSRPKTSYLKELGSYDSSRAMLSTDALPSQAAYPYPLQPSPKIIYSNAAQMKSGLKKGLTLNLNQRQRKERER
jgi:hypothetical protein